MKRSRIEVLPSAYFAAAALLLLVPLRWLLAWLLAASVHELGHILAIHFCGGRIRKLEIGAAGASIEILPMPPPREMICALSGPAGGLLLVLLFRQLPYAAFCALIQSAYNLLPIYPLDGGRVLRCVLEWFLGQHRGDNILRIIESVLRILFVMFGLSAFFFWNMGALPLLAALLLSLRNRTRKIPCKSRCLGLQ